MNFICQLLTWIQLIIGLKFAYGGLIINGHFGFEGLRGGIVFVVFFVFIVVQTFTVIGGCMATRRATKNVWVALYGIVIFFFICIPLLSEASEMNKIGKLTDKDIDEFCSVPVKLADKREKILEDKPKWVAGLLRMSDHFDAATERIIDDNMCVKDLCPCLDYNHHNPSQSPMLLYRNHFEVELEQWHRTNYEDSFWTKMRMSVPLHWTTDANEGYRSF